jgi:S1-C subfamily serine protease
MSARGEVPFQSKEVIRKCLDSVAWIQLYSHSRNIVSASGVCIDSTGVILTSGHLFDTSECVDELVVYIGNRRWSEGSIVEVSRSIDLAVIRLSGLQNLPVSKICRKTLPEHVDSPITVVGNKIDGKNLGLVVMPGAARPPTSMERRDPDYPNMTDQDLYIFSFGNDAANALRIQPGLSGAPLYTTEGLLAGIVAGANKGIAMEAKFGPLVATQGYAIRSTAILREM